MTANPFFPLDEMSVESNETEMMIYPQVDQSIYERRRQMVDTVVDYKEMRMRYSCAIKEVRTKFDVLNSEFNVRYQRNPITSINSRLKSSTSIMTARMLILRWTMWRNICSTWPESGWYVLMWTTSICWPRRWRSRMISRCLRRRIISRIPSLMGTAAII